MPYIITTYSSTDCEGGTALLLKPQSCRAVATLEEARGAIVSAVAGTSRSEAVLFDARLTYADSLSESGGTVGPLPDGTVIEVEQRQWHQLAEDVGWDFHGDAHRGEAELLDAYNARQQNAS